MSESRTLVGLGVSPGIAVGRPVVVENRPLPVMRVPLSHGQLDAEVARLRKAAKQAAERLAELGREATSKVGAEYASIFEAHRLMLEDPALLDDVERVIREESVNAEWALEEVTHRLISQFEELGDIYLRERRADVLDVATQLQRALQGRATPRIPRSEELAILVADDIPPSQ
ncbi:MAG TPA: phosphoenolpyruvate-utilizing N-terminal domain-containing protein, partial [Solirubrobacteraceae bacterium]|nr:phosphoenolpyruvate-utilizing N-terminal domain-containing protein [Solirubrobacteraceae bacterium]